MSLSTGGDLVLAIVEMREDDVAEILEKLIGDGVQPQAVLDQCREAMRIVGKRFEEGAAFIPELIMAGEIMKTVTERLKPLMLESGPAESLGCVVLGTVKGDIHDIGKDIVKAVLDAGGFEVVDLGVDVSEERFVEAIGERDSCMVALSCLLTVGFDSMKATVEAITAAGLRDRVKIMVGGAPINQQVCEYAGADGWGDEAATALELANTWASGRTG